MNNSPFSVIIGTVAGTILGYFIITGNSTVFAKIVLTVGLLSGIEIISRDRNY